MRERRVEAGSALEAVDEERLEAAALAQRPPHPEPEHREVRGDVEAVDEAREQRFRRGATSSSRTNGAGEAPICAWSCSSFGLNRSARP